MDATTSNPVSTADRGSAALMMFALRRDDAVRTERRHGDDDHHHHHHDHHDRGRDDDSASRVFVSLKAEVEGTLRNLVGGTADDEADTDGATATDAAPAAEFDAELKARVRISGPDGRIDLKMKLELDDVDAETFQSALQSFTETLYSALRALYGQDAQAPAPAPGDSAAVTAAALAADTPASTPSPTAAAAAVPASDAAAATSGTPATAEAVADTVATPAPTGSSSLQLRLRLTYTSFGDSVGTLAQRLSQPDGAAGVPSSIFDDLTERFERLLDAAGGADERPGLAAFLRALADRLSPPADTVLPGEPAPTPATSESAPTEPEAAPAAPTSSASFSISLRFTAIYRQVDAVGAPAPQPLALAA